MIAYCAAKKIPFEASAKKPYSMDRNLLHISFGERHPRGSLVRFLRTRAQDMYS